MNYRLIKQIPTMLGATVHIGEMDTGQRVVVKQAETTEEEAILQGYVRHIVAMQQIVEPLTIYPEVLYYHDTTLVMPFYEGGSLDDVSDKSVMLSMTAQVIDRLFLIAAMQPRVTLTPSERGQMSRSFLVEYANARLNRLERAVESHPEGQKWAAHAVTQEGEPLVDALSRVTSWIRDGTLERTAEALCPPALGLAAHGDLGLNNILLSGSSEAPDGVIFIDMRAQWDGNVPWWDPIMDLATLLAFHCRIEPALRQLKSALPDVRPRLSEEEILELCRDSKSFRTWVASDSAWAARLEVNLALRFLGNTSANLTIAPELPKERATVLAGLCIEQMGRARQYFRG